MLARGEVVADGSPSELMAQFGRQVVDVEGPDAESVAATLASRSTVTAHLRTARGFRIGLAGNTETLATVMSSAPRLTHLDVRAASLEDVYFSKTQTKQ